MEQRPSGTVHATAFLVADRGVLVTGPSGSGKSALAHEAMTRAQGAGLFAALVADDRVHLSVCGARLVACCPERLAGGLEVRGAGLFALPGEPSAVVHLLVRLVAEGDALRYPDGAMDLVEGVSLPTLFLPRNRPEAACRAVMARLLLAPWGAP